MSRPAHRFRVVVDFYAAPMEAENAELLRCGIGAYIANYVNKYAAFPGIGAGVVLEGFPDLYDQDEKRAQIETPFNG